MPQPKQGNDRVRNFLAPLLFLICGALGTVGGLHAETTIHVAATDPPGDEITLGRGETFYLRIAYTTDEPVSIWAEPYFEGQPADAGSNPSQTYTGSGEALGWFFFFDPGTRVDEVRIRVGDGSKAGTRVLATYPVQIIGSASAPSSSTSPAWVAELRAKAEAAQRAADEQRMNEPLSAGDELLVAGFMLVVGGIGLLSVGLPVWALCRWREGWRVAAAVPAAMMAFVVLRIAVGVAADPTSHNLWPFEILQTAVLSSAVIGVLMLMRKITGAARA
jgi:hypothetical protein